MPRSQRAVRPTLGESDKPVAPADLWEKLDAAVQKYVGYKPPDAFSGTEYAERMNIRPDTARKRLDYLVDRGVLETGKVVGKKWYRVKEGK